MAQGIHREAFGSALQQRASECSELDPAAPNEFMMTHLSRTCGPHCLPDRGRITINGRHPDDDDDYVLFVFVLCVLIAPTWGFAAKARIAPEPLNFF